jgi:uncharacterized protein with FMN-binding domain
MKSASRTTVLVLSVAFCGAAAYGLANDLVTPAPAIPVRNPFEPSHAASTASSAPGTAASTAAPTGTSPPLRIAANQQTLHDGSYTGSLEDAYYGFLRVRLDVQGGRIAGVQVLRYPSDNPTSRYINSLALPYLKNEVISAQTAYVDMVSGATLSSIAFLRSTHMALRQARG